MLILLKISSENFQNPLGKSGLDNLNRSRPALKAMLIVEFLTRSGSWFQYLITLLLKKSCVDLRDGPLEKLWGGGEFSCGRNFFHYQIPCMNFLLGHSMNIFYG